MLRIGRERFERVRRSRRVLPIRSITEEELCDLVETFEVLSGVSTPRDGAEIFDESSCGLWVRHAQEETSSDSNAGTAASLANSISGLSGAAAGKACAATSH